MAEGRQYLQCQKVHRSIVSSSEDDAERCLGVSTGKVVLPLRKGAIVIDLYQVRAVFRNTDAIAYVDSGDQGDDEDLAARWSLSVWWRFEHSVIVALIKS